MAPLKQSVCVAGQEPVAYHERDAVAFSPRGDLSAMYQTLMEHYEVGVEALGRLLDERGRHPDIVYDEAGAPLGYTPQFFSDHLDKQLIAHFGAEYRQPANAARAKQGLSPLPF